MPTAAKLFGVGPVLPVHDLPASAAFYCEKLSFEMDFVEAGHGSVTRGRVGIQFTQAPPDYQARDYPGWTYFFVDNVDSLCAEFLARGVTLTRELTSHAHGMREFQIEDLEGHKLRFGQYLES